MVSFGKFVQLGQSVNSILLRNRLQSYIPVNGLKSKPDLLSIDLPQKPKKPTSMFVVFVNHIREELQQQEPKLKSTEILKIAAQRWKNIDPSYKTTLQEEYNKKLSIYKQEMQQYTDSLTPEQQDLILSKKKSHKAEKVRDPRLPKKPLSSFFLYLNEQIPKEKAMNKQVVRKDIISKLGKAWRVLPQEEKQKYVVMSQKCKEEYKEALIKSHDIIKKDTE